MDPFFALAFFGSIVPIGLLVLVVIAVLSGRYEPDPARERPQAVYLAAVSFAAVTTLLGSIFLLVSSLLGLTTDDQGSETFESASTERVGSAVVQSAAQGEVNPFDEEEPEDPDGAAEDVPFAEEDLPTDGASFNEFQDNEDIASAVRAALLGAIAFALLWFHDPRLVRLAATSRGPGARVYSKYLYLLCFIAVLIVLGAGSIALFAAFGAIAPGVSGVGSRDEALRQLASAAVLTLAAAWVLRVHWRRADALARTDVDNVLVEPLVPSPPVRAEEAVPLPPDPDPPATRGRIVRRTTRPPAE